MLILTGIKQGRLANGKVEDVTVPYIDKFIQYVQGNILSVQDRNHALAVISEFVKGVLNHKISISKYGSRVVKLPMFKKRNTANGFTDIFKKAFDLTYPGIKYSFTQKMERTKEFQYYYSILIISKYESL